MSSWTTPKTVLGNKIIWDTSKIPGKRKKGTSSGKDDQLWRCRKTKKFEASLLHNLPHGACFVDAGAHFGDTVITMALYARDTLQRPDIRFVAFEPNPKKARFIEECAAANGFDSDINSKNTIRVISCVLGDETSTGGARARKETEKDWCKFDGRTSYEEVAIRGPLHNSTRIANEDDDKSTSDDESSCSSSSKSSSSSSNDNFLDIHRLDNYFDLIHPLGFLHVDVEGWEAKVLSGASELLTAPGSSLCYILAETFNRKEARNRGLGFSQTHEEDILEVMSNFSLFCRGDDVVDGERNLFFERVEE
mmetsp:Transcript_15586/g.32958  ORF Transcript_15586/g.32958 Transcript_15586/m.32958 type:complete len:307 (+) Transcript_15586:166-1086(+)